MGNTSVILKDFGATPPTASDMQTNELLISNGDTYLKDSGGSVVKYNKSGTSGAQTLEYVGQTANYTLTTDDKVVEVTNNAITLTLPTAIGNTGKDYFIFNTGSGTVTIDGNASELINNAFSITIEQYESVHLVCNGTNWVTGYISGQAFTINPVTVANLPGSPRTGTIAVVNDATAITYNSTVTGGGSLVAKVMYNGTNWVCA